MSSLVAAVGRSTGSGRGKKVSKIDPRRDFVGIENTEATDALNLKFGSH